MTFEVGAKVIHPNFGAGKIVAIDQKQFTQNVREYYIVHIPQRRMQVMVPTETAEEVGLRLVSRPAVFDSMWIALRSPPEALPHEFKQRKAELEERLKTGDIVKIAQVIRDLVGLQQERKLCRTDRDHLGRAETLVADELALAKGMEREKALSFVRSRVQSGNA